MAEGSLSEGLASGGWEVVLADDKKVTIHELRMEDFVAAEAWVRSERLNAFLEQTRQVRGINLPDEVRAKAMAEIINKVVSFDEVITCISGQLYCVYRSLAREDPQINLAWVHENLSKMEINVLSDLVFEITGLIKKEVEEEGPLETQDSTSTGNPFGTTFQGGHG